MSRAESTPRTALPALLLGGIAIGCSPIFVRLSEVGPIATAFWRLSLALVPLLLLERRRQAHSSLPSHRLAWRECFTVAVPGLFLASDLAAWHISLHLTSVANSTLLVNAAPIFVTLFSWLVLRQRIRSSFLVGLVISMAGVLVLKGGPQAFAGGHTRGDLVAVAAAALYAGYILTVREARHRYSTGQIMLWSTASAAACTGALSAVTETRLAPSSASGWLTLIALSWVSQLGGQGLIAYALAWLPATMSSLTLLIQPVVASLLAWLLLREPLSAAQVAGGLIVIGGIMLARRTA